MKFMTGDRVRRRVDNVVQVIYDVDSVNRKIKVNWLSDKGEMLLGEHVIPKEGQSPVILIPDPLRKRAR